MAAADKALTSLNRIKAGLKADKIGDRKKRAREEVASLFNTKKKKPMKIKAAWKHRFVCLAYKDQDKTPTTDFDKDEFHRAGLGEKEVVFFIPRHGCCCI